MRPFSIICLSLTCIQLGIPGPTEITYERDVAPILQKRCQSCHRPGEIGPMPLLTFEQARPWARAIREAVKLRKMPPWFADSQHGVFRNDRALQPSEVDTLVRWVDGGAPRGNAKDAPPLEEFVSGWRIGKPDVVFEMPKEFHVPAEGKVEYQWIMVPTGFTQDKWVQALEVRPGNPEVAHHVVVYAREPSSTYAQNYSRNEFFEYIGEILKTPKRKGRTMISSLDEPDHLHVWAPGADPVVFEPGTARLIKAGSDIVFQLHYATRGKPGKDRSRIGLLFAKEPVKQRVKTVGITNNAKILIPPGESNYKVRARVEVIRPVRVMALMPHMHFRGKSFRYSVRYPTGEFEVLLNVPQYRFHWQTTYYLAQPKVLPVGTVVTLDAVFDNSANNPDNPDPQATVKQGLQSWEEMMAGIVEVAFDPAVDVLDFFKDAPPEISSR